MTEVAICPDCGLPLWERSANPFPSCVQQGSSWCLARTVTRLRAQLAAAQALAPNYDTELRECRKKNGQLVRQRDRALQACRHLASCGAGVLDCAHFDPRRGNEKCAQACPFCELHAVDSALEAAGLRPTTERCGTEYAPWAIRELASCAQALAPGGELEAAERRVVEASVSTYCATTRNAAEPALEEYRRERRDAVRDLLVLRAKAGR